MKSALFAILLLCSAFPIAAQTAANAPSPRPTPPDLVALSGKTYHAARAGKVEPDGITYSYSGGVVKIPFTDLPESIRKQYGYDPQKQPRPKTGGVERAIKKEQSGSIRLTFDGSGHVASAVIEQSCGSAILDSDTVSYAKADWTGPPNTTTKVPFSYRPNQ